MAGPLGVTQIIMKNQLSIIITLIGIFAIFYHKNSFSQEFRSYCGTDLENRSAQKLLIDDGSSIILGHENVDGIDSVDIALLKLDSVGNLLWRKTYQFPGISTPYDICKSQNNGLIIS